MATSTLSSSGQSPKPFILFDEDLTNEGKKNGKKITTPDKKVNESIKGMSNDSKIVTGNTSNISEKTVKGSAPSKRNSMLDELEYNDEKYRYNVSLQVEVEIAKQRERFEHEIADLKRQNKELNDALLNFKRSNVALKKELDMSKQRESTATEMVNMQQQSHMDAAKKRAEDAEKQLMLLTQSTDELRRQLEDSKKETVQYLQTLTNIQSELQKSNLQIQQLQQQLNQERVEWKKIERYIQAYC